MGGLFISFMRHRKHRHSLGLTKEHRKAMLANLTAALFRHGRIQTTLAKAKALRPFAEPLITKAVKSLYATAPRKVQWWRAIHREIRDKDAVHVLMRTIAPEVAGRPGGYLRITKLCMPRIGDAAEMALIEFVEFERLRNELRTTKNHKIDKLTHE
jgi:large subunit ribosomal protein L17